MGSWNVIIDIRESSGDSTARGALWGAHRETHSTCNVLDSHNIARFLEQSRKRDIQLEVRFETRQVHDWIHILVRFVLQGSSWTTKEPFDILRGLPCFFILQESPSLTETVVLWRTHGESLVCSHMWYHLRSCYISRPGSPASPGHIMVPPGIIVDAL
jgi:hypothetical protein